MSTPVINTATLARLADKQVSDLAAEFGSLPPNIAEALQRRTEEANRATAEAAADEIIKLGQAKDAAIVATAQAIENLKKQQADMESQMANLKKAWLYGHATSNYLPLAGMLGMGAGGAKKELTKLPADWEPPAAAPAPAAT